MQSKIADGTYICVREPFDVRSYFQQRWARRLLIQVPGACVGLTSDVEVRQVASGDSG